MYALKYFALSLLILTPVCAVQVLSFSPILNSSGKVEIGLPVTLRKEIIYQLVQNYDCIVLSRSNGFPILEEQRYAVSVDEDPSAFPYPPAADYLSICSIRDDGLEISFELNYTKITGARDADVKQLNIKFKNNSELREQGAIQIADALARALKLKSASIAPKVETKNKSKTWAVLPFELILEGEQGSGMTPSRLVDVAYDAIGAALPLSETVDPDDLQAASNSLFTGATERKAAELGKQLAADYLLLGSVVEFASGYRADIQAVRCADAAVIGVSRATAGDWPSLETALARDIERLIPRLSNVPDIKIAEEEACLEEASVFLGIADTLAFTSRRDPWVKYQAARTFQVAAMLSQDTTQECRVINRLHVSIINHPLMYDYAKDWEELQQPLSVEMHNNWLIDEIEAMAALAKDCETKAALLEALDKAGQWEAAYKLMHEIMREQNTDFTEEDRRAADRLRITSLSGNTSEAEAFFDKLSPEIRKQFTLIQAALHFRRNQQPQREYAAMKERLVKNEWRTIDGGFGRFCELMKRYEEPERRIELLGQIPRKFQKDPHIMVLRYQSYSELEMTAEAKELAAILLKRSDIGTGGHATQKAFKHELRELIGSDAAWPPASAIQNIPNEYKMYLQPVGDYPRHILEEAAKRAGDFFGCDFVVRDTIPIPTARSVYYKDMKKYVAVPLLRRFVTARPPPPDAIYQVYLVDQRFLVYGRGPTTTCYRKGLGYLLSYEPYQRYIDNDRDRIEALSYGIIHGFRFFVERSQEIWYDDAPNNFPCANSRASSLKTWKRENGYCPGCVKNYRSADINAVFEFTQALPDEASFTNDYIGGRHRIDEEERISIRNYADNVSAPRR